MNDLAFLSLQRAWWLLLLRGIIAIVFGIAAILWPGLTLAVLAIIFGLYILVDGLLNLITGMSHVGRQRLWFLPLILGIIEIGVGVYLLRNLSLAVSALVLAVGLVLIVKGILEFVAGFERGVPDLTRLFVLVLAVISFVGGVVVLLYPSAGGLAFVWVLGVYGIVSGALRIAVSTEMRMLLDDREAKAI